MERTPLERGQWVRVKEEMKMVVDMCPNDLNRIGWPDEFYVREVADQNRVVILWPCCHHMKNRASSQYLCMAHPAEYFEAIPTPKWVEEAGEEPNDFLHVDFPWGELLGIESLKGEKPELVVRVAGGKVLALNGKLAERVQELLKEEEIL